MKYSHIDRLIGKAIGKENIKKILTALEIGAERVVQHDGVFWFVGFQSFKIGGFGQRVVHDFVESVTGQQVGDYVFQSEKTT